MATGALRFRTPHIEEIPSTNTKQAPGFAYVAVDPGFDPSKAQLKPTNAKRARTTGPGGQTEAQREALTARQQREIQKRIDALNADNSRDVNIPIPKRKEDKAGAGGALKDGKTTNTKKILSSGKEFKHYLDDEEAELARTGGRIAVIDGEAVGARKTEQRASKTPYARRKQQEQAGSKRSSLQNSPAPSLLRRNSTNAQDSDAEMVDVDDAEDEALGLPRMPTMSEIEALLNAPPLSYNQARSAPPPPDAPPPRTFCETCGYWGRVKCMKCGTRICSVYCREVHERERCFKFYA